MNRVVIENEWGHKQLLDLVRSTVETYDIECGSVCPEPQLGYDKMMAAREKIDAFIKNTDSTLEWVGNVKGHNQYIYRHHNGDIYTFWYKHCLNCIRKYTNNKDVLDSTSFVVPFDIELGVGAGV